MRAISFTDDLEKPTHQLDALSAAARQHTQENAEALRRELGRYLRMMWRLEQEQKTARKGLPTAPSHYWSAPWP